MQKKTGSNGNEILLEKDLHGVCYRENQGNVHRNEFILLLLVEICGSFIFNINMEEHLNNYQIFRLDIFLIFKMT